MSQVPPGSMPPPPPPPGYGGAGWQPAGPPPAGGGTNKWWWVLLAVLVVLVLGVGTTAVVVLLNSDDDSSAADEETTSGEQDETDDETDETTDEATDDEATDETGEPATDECRQLTLRDAEGVSNASPVVPCTEEHTTLTYHVGQVSGPATTDGAIILECIEELPQALGLSPEEAALTGYQLLYFVPDDAQSAAGADWFRCDLALLTPTSLTPLPTDGDLVPSPLPDNLAACLTAGQQFTTCDQPHRFRAYDTWQATGPDQRPTDKRMINQGMGNCPGADTTYYFTWPSEATWAEGYRLSTCWKPDPVS